MADIVKEDLSEIFQDKVRAGARTARLWFWGQTALFCARFSWERMTNGGSAQRGGSGAKGGDPSGTGAGGRRASGWRIRSRQTVRRLARDWRYSLGTVLILGLGIGPASTMLSVVNKVLLRPLGYAEPDRLGLVRIDIGELLGHPGLSMSEITAMKQTEGLFKAVEGTDRGQEVTLGEGEEMVPVFMKRVSPGFFEMLGVSPIAGRHFTPDDPEAPVVIISHRLWQNRYGADPSIVGQTLLMNGNSMEVAGVMPADFSLRVRRGSAVHTPVDIWFPMRIRDQGTFWGFPTLVRLEDGVTFDQVNGALPAFAQSLKEASPGAYEDASLRFVVHPLLPDLVQETRPAINAALAGVLLLLFTAVVNATALMVVGLKGREQELAVRSAIGAGRRALVAEMVMESVVLAAVAAALGCGLATLGISALKSIIPRSVPRWETITLGWEPLILSAILGLLALLLAGVIPAWKVSRGTPWEGLSAASGRGRTGSTRGQSVLVGTQVALAVVLLFGALQLGRSARELASAELRFDARGVLGFKAPVDFGAIAEGDSQAGLYLRFRDRLMEIPGVEIVGAISDLPLSGTGPVDAFTPNLSDTVAAWDNTLASYLPVLPGYFESVSIPLHLGRFFTDAEAREGEEVIIVDETLARMASQERTPSARHSAWGGDFPIPVLSAWWLMPGSWIPVGRSEPRSTRRLAFFPGVPCTSRSEPREIRRR